MMSIMKYLVGTSKQDITCFIPGIGMMGYGQPHNIVKEVATPLWSRTLVIKQDQSLFIFVHLELAFVSQAIKQEVIDQVNRLHPEWDISHKNLAITAQHTHSGPGGFSHYPFYNFTIPGFQKKVFEKIVSGIVLGIEEAYVKNESARISWGQIRIDESKEIAFNRSMSAFSNNPDAPPLSAEENHLAVDRMMEGLTFVNDDQKPIAFMSWFGVHGTSISSFNNKIHSDNKGIAADCLEKNYPGSTAFFFQSSAGDISPNFIWDKKLKRMRGKFSDQYESAAFNGEMQFREFEKISFGKQISGSLRSWHLFYDITSLTSQPAHGVAFFKGTLEGPGISKFLALVLSGISRSIKAYRLIKDPLKHKSFYEQQGQKDIILDHRDGSFIGIPLRYWKLLPPIPEKSVNEFRKAARSNSINTLPWVPPILPFQILKIGKIIILFVPGEITTIAGKRLRDHILNELKNQDVDHVIITSYANAYMGYIVTPEEYDKQSYEGGHTVYGKNTLFGVMSGFSVLTKIMTGLSLDQSNICLPFNYPIDELERRSF